MKTFYKFWPAATICVKLPAIIHEKVTSLGNASLLSTPQVRQDKSFARII